LAPAALFLACLLPGFHFASAEEIYAAYRVTYAGLPAGEIRFGFTGDGLRYRDKISVESAGLPRWITHFRGVASGEGRFAADGSADPQSYDVIYDLRQRRDERIDLRFTGKAGNVLAERDSGDTSRKPPIAEELRRNTVDPLAAMASIRQALRLHGGGAQADFTIPVYDGTRRFDVLAHVESEDEAGGRDGLVHLHLTLLPIAGFWEESGGEANPSADPRPVEAAFTADDKLLPVSMRVNVWYLPMVVKFDRLCASFESCGKDGG
jgi:hypothetical protein